MSAFSRQDIEKLEVLDGSRANASKTRQAVRIEDVSALFDVSELIQSKPAAAAPTKAEYDQLRNDVLRLTQALASVATALSAKLRQ